MKTKITKAVIPAAGFGTRFLPATKAIPKEMFPIIDKPTIQFIVEEAIESGITDLLIIVSKNKNPILDHFDYNFELEQKLLEKNKHKEVSLIKDFTNKIRIQYIRQKETLGLGHAILLAKEFVNNEPFAILLGDDVVFKEKKDQPAILQCINAFDKVHSSIVGVQEVEDDNVSKYGIVDPKNLKDISTGLFQLKSVVEKPDRKDAPSNFAILGRYVLTPKIFDELKNTKKDIRNEIELTNAILSLMKKEKVYAKQFTGKRFDIGSKLGYVKSFIYLAAKDNDISLDIKNYILEVFQK